MLLYSISSTEISEVGKFYTPIYSMSVGINMFMNGKLDSSFLTFICARLSFKIVSECNIRDAGIALLQTTISLLFNSDNIGTIISIYTRLSLYHIIIITARIILAMIKLNSIKINQLNLLIFVPCLSFLQSMRCPFHYHSELSTIPI